MARVDMRKLADIVRRTGDNMAMAFEAKEGKWEQEYLREKAEASDGGDSAEPSDAEDEDYSEEEQPKKKKAAAKPKGSTANAGPPSNAKVVERLRKSLASSILAQMVYKKGLKHGTSRINVEIPNMTAADVEALLGRTLYARATKGPKQITVATTSPDELEALAGKTLHKPLRFGAMLVVLNDALKLVYSRDLRILKATGSCVMLK